MHTKILVCALLASCGGAPAPNAQPSATPVASTTATATVAASPPLGGRTYTRGSTSAAVVLPAESFSRFSISPDGLLVAMSTSVGDVVFFDVDRARAVGQVRVTTRYGAQPPRWIGDDYLVVETPASANLYDGRTGALLGAPPVGPPGAVITKAGIATLRVEGSVGELVPIAHPNDAPLRIKLNHGDPSELFDLGGGAFLYSSSEGVFAFEADGTPRFFSLPGQFDDVEVRGTDDRVLELLKGASYLVVSGKDGKTRASLATKNVAFTEKGGFYVLGGKPLFIRRILHIGAARTPGPHRRYADLRIGMGVSAGGRYVAAEEGDAEVMYDLASDPPKTSEFEPYTALYFGRNDEPRVAALVDTRGPGHLFDVRGGVIGPPLVALRSDVPPEIAEVDGATFGAQCGSTPAVEIGPKHALPARFPFVEPASSVGPLTSPDGLYRASWTGVGDPTITLTDTRAGSTLSLDAGDPVRHVAFHPNGLFLVSGAYQIGVGSMPPVDPSRSVRLFSLKTGAVVKRFSATDFDISADGSRMLISGDKETFVLDLKTSNEVRRWPFGVEDFKLAPDGKSVFLTKYDVHHDAVNGNVGVPTSFLESLEAPRRVVDLPGLAGKFVFDASSSYFVFAGAFSGGEPESADIYEVKTGKRVGTVEAGDYVERVEILNRDVLAVAARGRVILHKLSDGSEVTLYGAEDDGVCHVFAVDAAGHYEGEPGNRLAIRMGDDLRKSELLTSGSEYDSFRDDQLLEKFLKE